MVTLTVVDASLGMLRVDAIPHRTSNIRGSSQHIPGGSNKVNRAREMLQVEWYMWSVRAHGNNRLDADVCCEYLTL